MGLRDWLARGMEPRHDVAAAVAWAARLGADEPVKVSGTTTGGASGCAAVFAEHVVTAGAPLLLVGELITEPDNPVDANAVAVYVSGYYIGYLPGYLTASLTAGAAGARRAAARTLGAARTQLWSTPDPKSVTGLRVVAWTVCGEGDPALVGWPYDRGDPPAITTAQQRGMRAAATSRMVDDGLTDSNPDRAATFAAGMVGDRHYLETVEPIQQLKRDGQLGEALELCYRAIAVAENVAEVEKLEAPPWYTEQAAIIHRKLGDRDAEIAVLQRWLDACPADRRGDSEIAQRLEKLRH